MSEVRESTQLLRRAVAYERLAAKELKKRNGLQTRVWWYERRARELRAWAERARAKEEA